MDIFDNFWGGSYHKVYEVFARTAKKWIFLTIFGGVVTIATADTPNWNYECVANSNVNRLGHVKIVHKIIGGGVVTIATADTPNPKVSWCGKFNCKTRWACEKCAHML